MLPCYKVKHGKKSNKIFIFTWLFLDFLKIFQKNKKTN